MNSQLDTNGYASNSMDAIVVAKAVDVKVVKANTVKNFFILPLLE